jgi:myo-inositol 2-dehydrogenase / D-chiro-inositol 1-dehydrogenase
MGLALARVFMTKAISDIVVIKRVDGLEQAIRYGLVGTGMMGVEHIQNLAITPGAELVAIADPVAASLGWAKAALGERAARVTEFADGAALAASGLVDAVIVASPNYTHREVLAPLFDAGLHILCEKPVATTIEDARWVVERAAQASGVFWTAMEYRYMPPAAEFVTQVHAGRTGILQMLSIREHRFPFLMKVGDWNRFSVNTGGTMVEKCCHFFDLMRLIVGSEAVRVYCSGAMDVNHLDETYDGKRPDIIDNSYTTVDFAEGDLVFSPRTGFMNPKAVERKHIAVDEAALKAGHHHGATFYQHQKFIAAVRSDGAVEVSAHDGLMAVAIGTAAEISAREKRVVTMAELGF